MRTLTVIPTPGQTNAPVRGGPRPPAIAGRPSDKQSPLTRVRHAAARLGRNRRGVADIQFTPLIDAKVAGKLLGVPHTWLLAQARAQRIPHHRLGHYVRFNPDDLKEWLAQTRSTPNGRC